MSNNTARPLYNAALWFLSLLVIWKSISILYIWKSHQKLVSLYCSKDTALHLHLFVLSNHLKPSWATKQKDLLMIWVVKAMDNYCIFLKIGPNSKAFSTPSSTLRFSQLFPPQPIFQADVTQVYQQWLLSYRWVGTKWVPVCN